MIPARKNFTAMYGQEVDEAPEEEVYYWEDKEVKATRRRDNVVE